MFGINLKLTTKLSTDSIQTLATPAALDDLCVIYRQERFSF